jgi:hypothetical protein
MVTNTTPPGWYPDPWNSSAQRFWDGGQWTDHVAARSGVGERPRLAEGAPIYGLIIWLIAALPVISGVLVWFIRIDFAGYIDQLRRLESWDGTGPMPAFDPFSMFGPGYWVNVVVSIVLYAALIVLAALDRRRLLAIGVERPFHWAWAFLSPIVYVIGRSVIVRRVASPRGLAPMWVAIGVTVAVIISSSIWSAIFSAQLMSQLGDLVNSLPTT